MVCALWGPFPVLCSRRGVCVRRGTRATGCVTGSQERVLAGRQGWRSGNFSKRGDPLAPFLILSDLS